MTARIRILLMSFCFALLLAPSQVAFGAGKCDSADLLVKRAAVFDRSKICSGCQKTFLGDKKDFVVTESVVSQWIVNHQPVMNKRYLYVIQKSPRLIPVYPEKFDVHYDVQLPGLTVALLEHNENGYFRLANLCGSVVFVHVLIGGKVSELSLGAGEEICLAPPRYPPELLIPADSIEREPITTCNSNIRELNMAKNKIERKQVFDRERLLTCEKRMFANPLVKSARRQIARARPLHPVTAVSEHRPTNP